MTTSKKQNGNLDESAVSFIGEDEKKKIADAHVEVLRDISEAAVWEYYVLVFLGLVVFILGLLSHIFN